MSDERDFKEPQEERKFIVEILKGKYSTDECELFFYRINSIDDMWQKADYSVELVKQFSKLMIDKYAKIFGLPEVKESQITYIETDEIY